MKKFLTDETPFYKRLAYILFSLLSIGYIAMVGKEILAPLLFSILFSIVLLPVAKYIERKGKLPRGIASLLALIFFVGLLSCLFYLLGTQMSRLASDWPLFKRQLAASLENLQDWIAKDYHVNTSKQLKYIHNATDGILSSGTEIVSTTFLSLSSVLLFFVFIMIDLFFLLFYRRHILHFLVAVFKEENSDVVYAIIGQVLFIIRKYIIGLLLEMGIVSTVVCLAFWIFGIKYALLLGLLTGILNLIPYLGIFTALLLSVLITFASASLTKVFIVICIIVAVHLMDSNILLPMVVGSRVKINALITVLGVVIGEMIWGIPGMFLSIPVIAVLKIIFDRIESLQPWGMLLGEESKENNVTVAKE